MRLFKAIALSLLGVIVVMAGLFIYLLGPANAQTTDKQDFVVVSGSSTAAITQDLAKKHLIRSSFALFIFLRASGTKILPGTYELSPAESSSVIAKRLLMGEFKTVKVTIIEGWRLTQMETYFVTEKKLTQLHGFAESAQTDEGYLFPDTYDVKVDITTAEMIALMKDNFTKRTTDLTITPEVVSIASIVEREAKSDSERSAIAGVYTNRLKKGMRLQADPTIQYAKGNWEAVTVAEYKSVISPYNTYLNDGLPPTPICSPGLASLTAAAHPAVHDYLYFFHAKGQTYFSKTLEEHQAKVRQHF